MLAGETLDIMVSTDPPAKFNIEIFRTGYYGGRGARLMTTLGPLQGTPQPIPPVGDKRLRECRWTPSTTLKIPADWLSGVYLGRLTTVPDAADQPYWQSYVIFIVRDTRRADVLFQCSDNTWQAYNRWPANDSLYTDPRGAHARDVAVSFDRPYGRQPQYTGIVNDPLSVGSGEFLSFEQPLAYFLEEHGYDVTYCTNSDCLDASQTHAVQGVHQRRPRRVLGRAAVPRRRRRPSRRASTCSGSAATRSSPSARSPTPPTAAPTASSRAPATSPA